MMMVVKAVGLVFLGTIAWCMLLDGIDAYRKRLREPE